MKNFIYVLSIVALISCASDNEQTGLDKIAAHYSADVSYTKSLNKSANTPGQSAFNIIAKNSSMLDSLLTGQTSTNIASMFFGALTPEEQEACDVITVKIINSVTNKNAKFKYNGPIVKDCWDQSKIFHAFSENLLNEDYDSIANNLLKKYYTETISDELANFMDLLKQEHGKLVSYKLTGIGVITSKDKSENYQYSGFLTFKDGYTRPYIMLASTDKDKDDITGYLLEEGIQL